jgi:hypothetical protein
MAFVVHDEPALANWENYLGRVEDWVPSGLVIGTG